MTDRLMTSEELASYLKVTPNHVRRMTCRKQLPYIKVSARFVRYSKNDIDAWLFRKTVRENPIRKRLAFAASILLTTLLISNGHAAEGLATYYTAKSCAGEAKQYGLKGSYWGAKTANGEAFNESALTCALRRRDFGGSYVVYGHDTGRSVVVRHNDFGPGKKPTAQGKIIDLTPAAFKAVCGDLKLGVCRVSVQEVTGGVQ